MAFKTFLHKKLESTIILTTTHHIFKPTFKLITHTSNVTLMLSNAQNIGNHQTNIFE